jgi:signal transduction histidine kinase
LSSSFELNVLINEEQRYFRMKAIPLIFEKGEHGVGILLEDITPMKKYQQELEEEVRLRTEALIKANDALQREMVEHKDARIALARNEARLRRAEEVADFGNLEVYIETGTAILSRGAQALLGVPETESTLSHIFSLVLEDYRAALDDAWQKLRNESDSFHEKFKIRRPNDQAVITLQSIAEFDRKQNSIFIVIHDISDRMRAEDAVRRATKQIVLLNSVTRHDILNQLNTLSLHVAYLKRKTEDAMFLDLLKMEEQLTDTIRNQIIFTRDYQNIGLEPPQWTNVAEMIAKALTLKELDGIEIAIGTGSLEIFSDLLIEKVYFNLVDNAMRHGKRVSRIDFGYQMSGQGLILFCEDNGCGVPDDDKTKIFERGFGINTGYGLFLVREILSITDFSIRECGVYGEGARFEILIPTGSYRFKS